MHKAKIRKSPIVPWSIIYSVILLLVLPNYEIWKSDEKPPFSKIALREGIVHLEKNCQRHVHISTNQLHISNYLYTSFNLIQVSSLNQTNNPKFNRYTAISRNYLLTEYIQKQCEVCYVIKTQAFHDHFV